MRPKKYIPRPKMYTQSVAEKRLADALLRVAREKKPRKFPQQVYDERKLRYRELRRHFLLGRALQELAVTDPAASEVLQSVISNMNDEDLFYFADWVEAEN